MEFRFLLIVSCCNQYKDTNLKAIHNHRGRVYSRGAVVAISTKIQIWKQFTTEEVRPREGHQLLQSVQRYKFESNSQLRDYINVQQSVVAISTKIQIWKQFTTRHRAAMRFEGLLQSVQRYKFESNSQLMAHMASFSRGCCNQYKDTNLKAIHNCHRFAKRRHKVVAISTKIQIWKQFTTGDTFKISTDLLLQSVQRYKFESNSQRISSLATAPASCCNQYKDTNLKAIHNGGSFKKLQRVVVAISTKIQIWKQFTTGKCSSS